MKRVIISAYSCEPGFTSEREVGWRWSVEVARRGFDVTVFTRQTNRKTIEEYIKRGNSIPRNLKFEYFDLPPWMRFWKKGERGLYLYYSLWQIGSTLAMYRTIRKEKVEVVHYLTFGNLIYPLFYFLLPAKILIGPAGGFETIPLKIVPILSRKGILYSVAKDAIVLTSMLNPLLYLNCIRAERVFVRTNETFRALARFCRDKLEVLLETGFPEEFLRQGTVKKKKNEKFTIVSVGRFIHSKAFPFLIKVIEDFRRRYDVDFRVILVGDGPERVKVERLVRRYGLEDIVEITGWVSRERVANFLSEADVYLSTSVKEGGSWALMEAIAMGLPIVSFKTTGMDVILCDKCAIKIPPDWFFNLKRRFSEALYRLYRDPDLRISIAENARRYAMENFSWDALVDRVVDYY